MNIKHIPLLILAALLLGACGGAADGGTAVPILPLAAARQTPAEVVGAFLDAWNVANYDAMYALVSARSQQQFPREVFQARYEAAALRINLTGIRYTLGDTVIQGTTAAVTHDVTILSAFDPIDDLGRTMRLVDEGGAWRVVWTSMDIINGMAGSARLDVSAQRPPRGNILDRSGLPLATTGGRMVVMYTQRQNIPSEDDCIATLTGIVRRGRAFYQRLFADYAPETIFYLGELDGDTYDRNAGNLTAVCGVSTLEYTTRTYYNVGAAAHLVGYLGRIPVEQLADYVARGYNDGDLVGLLGVERAYEEQLAGRAARVLRILDPDSGTVLRQLGSSVGSDAVDVQLTIDRDLQSVVAQTLYDAYSYAAPNWGQFSPGAAAVVLDVNTGAVLALASYPGFDPNIFNPDNYASDPLALVNAVVNTDTRQPLKNRVTQDAYFPGSVFKLVTAAAGAGEGLFGPDDTFDCGLQWDGRQYGDTFDFRVDWRDTDNLDPAGVITLSQGIAASCNPFFYQIGALLYQRSPTLLVDYARRMGMGAPTGLAPILVETGGILDVPTNPETAINNAIGQGVQVTPMQMAMMVAGLANGGTLYRPYVVQRAGDQSFGATVLGDMGLSPTTLQIIRDGMCLSTTDELGTSWFVFYPRERQDGPDIGYTVCGKTGTAQTGAQPNAWFVAYAPRDNPQVAVVVLAQFSREGSEVAAPIARRILDYYFNSPTAPFPDWWQQDYVPLDLPQGSTGG